MTCQRLLIEQANHINGALIMHDSSTEMDAEAEDAKQDRKLWDSLMRANLARQIKFDLATIKATKGRFLRYDNTGLQLLLKHLSMLRRIEMRRKWICTYKVLPKEVREEILCVMESLYQGSMGANLWLLRGCLDWDGEFGDGLHFREYLKKAIEQGCGEAALILAWRDFQEPAYEDPSCLDILSNLRIAVEAECSTAAAVALLDDILRCFEETNHLQHDEADTAFSIALDIIESLCLSRQYSAERILKFGIYFEENAETRADIDKARYWYEVAMGYDGNCGCRRLMRLDQLER